MGFIEDLHASDPDDGESARALFERWRDLPLSTKSAIIDQAEMKLQENARTLIRVWGGAVQEMPEQPSFVVGINTIESILDGALPGFGSVESFLVVVISALVILLKEKLGVVTPDLEKLLEEK